MKLDEKSGISELYRMLKEEAGGIGNVLSLVRGECGYTQADVAGFLGGYSQSYYSLRERGCESFDPLQLAQIMALLDVTPERVATNPRLIAALHILLGLEGALRASIPEGGRGKVVPLGSDAG